VFGTATNPANAQQLSELELAARPIGVKLQFHDVLNPKEIETAFQSATKARVDAVLVLGGPFFIPQRIKIAELAIKSGLPAMYSRSEFVEDGGL
jgi:putative ABC transport system substrate-binding protein